MIGQKWIGCASLALISMVWAAPPHLTGDPRLAAGSAQANRLDQNEARRYLLTLINQDRAALRRPPLELDEVATRVGQTQAELMVRIAAMTHADAQGRLPVQRYTEAGGCDRVNENVALTGTRRDLSEEIVPDPHPTFTRSEIEAIEASYFNQIAPNDRHRRNILAPEHTHVGIGLARGQGENSAVVGNAQEFVDRYFDELTSIKVTSSALPSVKLEGRLTGGRSLRAIGVAHAPGPEPMNREALRRVKSYAVPAAYVKRWAEDASGDARLSLDARGQFSVILPHACERGAGLYYIGLWVHDPQVGEVLASLRTVALKSPASVKEN